MIGLRPYCTFEVDRLLFGVEVVGVLEVIRHREPTRVPTASPVVLGLINLRGQVVTMLDLRRRLGLGLSPYQPRVSPQAPAQAGIPPMGVILRDPGGPIGLVVDAIGDVLDVDESRIEATPSTIPESVRRVARGVYRLPDRALLVLEIPRLLEPSP